MNSAHSASVFYMENVERGGWAGWGWGEGGRRHWSELGCTDMRVYAHAHDHMAIRAHSLPTVELGNVRKSPPSTPNERTQMHTHTHTHSLYCKKNAKHFTAWRYGPNKQTNKQKNKYSPFWWFSRMVDVGGSIHNIDNIDAKSVAVSDWHYCGKSWYFLELHLTLKKKKKDRFLVWFILKW